MPTKSHVTIDHDEIRDWAEERGGQPSSVKGTGGQGAGIIRIDFPGYSGEGKLEPIGWDAFFDKFEESNLAFVYQDTTARGQKSNFNKLVSRESVNLQTGDTKAAPPRRQRKAGATRKKASATGERRAPSAQAARTAKGRSASKRGTSTPSKTGGRAGAKTGGPRGRASTRQRGK